jgi:mannose-1-phosphate guanylyltransferase/mannose-6-phosphate isomerase
MIPVILSGGSGSRLWPLSRQRHPKQFLPLVGEESMFQQTLTRLPGYCADPIVVSNEDHRFIVTEQLEKIALTPSSVILEPFGRNTAPALALAALHALETGDEEAVLLVLPADHYISDLAEFHQALEVARQSAEQGNLVLFGIQPSSPETGYGYLKKGSTVRATVFEVDEFVEKPDLETAMQYLASGDYLWNSGMFVMRARRYLEELSVHFEDIYHTCKLGYEHRQCEGVFMRIAANIFEHCPDDSIDYAVMEKTNAAVSVSLAAGWSDLGSWSSLWDNETKDEQNNVVRGDVISQDSKGCYVRSDERLVALVGVEDLVVVDTDDAVLVAHKDKVQNVKGIVAHLKKHGRTEHDSHREVRRPWGSYDTVDLGSRFQVKNIKVKPGASLSLQKHHHRAEHWVVVSGTAEVTCGEKVFLLSENQSTYIPVGEVHRLKNPGTIPLEIIEIQSGSYLGEDDIVRFEDIYGRVDDKVEPARRVAGGLSV